MKSLSYLASIGLNVIRRSHARINAAAKRMNRKLCIIGARLHAVAERLDWALLGCMLGLYIADITGLYSASLHHLEGAHIQYSASVVWLGIWVKRQSEGEVV